MANDLFLRLDGITGDSIVKGHEHEIEVLTLGWQVGNLGHANAKAGVGKPTFQDIRVTKKTDVASAQLYRHCCTGQLIDKATIFAQQAGADGDYLEIDLTEAFVTLYELGLSASTTIETVTFGYSSLAISYKTQDAKGATQSTGTAGWDISKNAAI